MWCQIISQLQTAKDKENASNCSIYFRQILLDQRTQYLFPMVVNTLVSLKIETREPELEDAKLSSCVAKRDIFKCRLVSSLWNLAIETCYERLVMTGLLPFMDDQKVQSQTLNSTEWTNIYTFSASQIQIFEVFVSDMIQRQTSEALKNPFLGRFVAFHVCTSTQEIYESFTNLMTSVLEKFGHEIWYIILDIDFLYWSSLDERYERLIEWITLMPNLLSLQVKFSGRVDQKVLRDHPLPALHKLMHLKVSGMLTCVNVVNQMLSRYDKISYLEINDILTMNITLSPHLFINLKGLYIKGKRTVCSEILHWIGYYSKLQKLVVCNHEYIVRLSRQFQIINKYWSESLTDLTLGIGEFERFESKSSLNLRLPQLTQLKIIKDHNLILDFIKTLRSLKVLNVTLNNCGWSHLYKQTNLPKQELLFVGFETRMQESNIWDILVNLRILTINVMNFYYKCYEYTKLDSGAIERKLFTKT